MTNQEEMKEKLLSNLLKELENKVFIKSTNSVTGDEESLTPFIEDMEAIIAISGEWDREDLKEILFSQMQFYREKLLKEVEGLRKEIPNNKILELDYLTIIQNRPTPERIENSVILLEKRSFNQAIDEVIKVINK